jgi:hypothetical protein
MASHFDLNAAIAQWRDDLTAKGVTPPVAFGRAAERIGAALPLVTEFAVADRLAKRPPALLIVAAVFIFAGISAGWTTVALALHGSIRPNPAVCGVIIGIGLLLRSPRCRMLGVISLWLSFFAILALSSAIAFGVITDSAAHITVGGFGLGPRVPAALHLPLLGAGCCVTLLVTAWMNAVLRRHDVRSLFIRRPANRLSSL